jgi:GAF domain-containing protein
MDTPPIEAHLGMAEGSDAASAARALLGAGVASAGACEGSLLALDAGARELVFCATEGDAASEAKLLGQRVPLGSGVTGLAALSEEVQIGAPTFHDVEQTERKGAGPTAVMAAPVLAAGELVGVLTAVSFRAGRRFSAAHGELYGRLAAAVGLLIDQHRRLNALGGAAQTARAAGPDGRLASAVAGLAAGSPGDAWKVARVLEALEAVLAAAGAAEPS